MKKSKWLLVGAFILVAYLLWKWSKTPQRIPVGGGGFVDGNPK
jgi:hypothetical protein